MLSTVGSTESPARANACGCQWSPACVRALSVLCCLEWKGRCVAWRAKRALSCGRVGFEGNQGCCVLFLLWALHAAPSVRLRAGDHVHPPVCVRRACCVGYNRNVALVVLFSFSFFLCSRAARAAAATYFLLSLFFKKLVRS